ncbi:MAG: VWA domain-containing protein [Janthinobacterium lividum]
MNFLWPELLWLLLLLPALLLLYVWLLRRRTRRAVHYASFALLRQAMGPAQGLRRHVPPLLLLLGMAALLVAIARPAAVVTLPSQSETVILAVDVSGSMRANDVLPTRIAAAQAAARAFVAEQPRTTRLGVVSFAGTASVVQPPTLNREDVLGALDRFQLQNGTAVGSGILVALKTIFPDLEFDLRASNPRVDNETVQNDPARSGSLDHKPKAGAEPFKPVPPGSYTSAVIILLTDGQTTTGPDPIEASKMAAERGVKVYTVGIGTTNGEILGAEGWSMRVRLDEEALKKIASLTNGEYFYAGTASELKKIYQTLHARLILEKKETEVTALFAAAGAFLVMLAALLSMLWFNRVL